MNFEDLALAEIEEVFIVTPQSIARHCGLISDPPNPDVRSEERRIVDLERQVCPSCAWDLPCTKHLATRSRAEYRNKVLSPISRPKLACPASSRSTVFEDRSRSGSAFQVSGI